MGACEGWVITPHPLTVCITLIGHAQLPVFARTLAISDEVRIDVTIQFETRDGKWLLFRAVMISAILQ